MLFRLNGLPLVLAVALLGGFEHPAAVAAEGEKPQAIAIAELKRNGPVDFETEVLPVLQRNCLACHNATKDESELVLETPLAMLKGGVEGPAVVPGKSGESLLLKLASHAKNPVMPPKNNDAKAKPLTPDELGLIKLWIDEGAKGEVKSNAVVKWQPLPPGVNPIFAVAISPDGQYAAAGRANQIFLYHVPSKRELGRLTDPALLASGMYQQQGVAQLDLVQSLAFNPEGNLLAAGGFREVKLWRRTPPQKQASLEGVDAAVRSLAVNASGQLAALGLENGAIRLVNVADGKLQKTLAGHVGAVTGIAFSADGAKLVSGGTDKSVRLWNVAGGTQEATYNVPSEILALALVNKESLVATSGGDNSIRLWPVPGPEVKVEGDTEKKLNGHGQPATALYAVGETQLVSASPDGTARLWETTTSAQVRQFDHGAPVHDVAVHAGAKRLVTTGANGVAKLFNFENAQPVAELKGDYRVQLAVAAKDRETGLAKRHLANSQGDLKETQERQKKEEEEQKKAGEVKTKAEAEFKTKDEAAKKPVADKDEADKLLAAAADVLKKAEEAAQAAGDAAKKTAEESQKANSGSDDNAKKQATEANQQAQENLRKANEETNKAKQAHQQADQKVKQLAGPAQKAMDERLSAQRAMEAAVRGVERSAENVKQAQAAVPAAQNVVMQREQLVKQREQELEAIKQTAAASDQTPPLKSAAFSREGSLVATAGEGQKLHVWSAETGAAIEIVEGLGGPASRLAFAGENVLLAAAGNAAHAWNLAAPWQLERTLGAPDKPNLLVDRVTALAFSPDGKVLATGGGEPSRSGELKLWQVDNGAPLKTISEPHSDVVFALEFSPDGTQIATCGADRFGKVFNLAEGKLVHALEGHTHHVLGVSWQSDGRVVATSSADKTVKVWNAQTGEQLRTIPGFGKEVTCITFLRDPARIERLYIAAGDRTVRLYRSNDGGSERSFDGMTDFACSVRASDDGNFIIAGGLDSVVRLWKSDNNAPLATFAPPPPEAPGGNKQAAN